MFKLYRVGILLSAMAVGLLSANSVASAGQISEASSSVATKSTSIAALASSGAIQPPMTLVAIDETQAVRAGNRVAIEGNYKVLYDGKTGAELARVPANSTVPSGAMSANQGILNVNPNSFVPGNCGSSFYWLVDKANFGGKRLYEFWTGFNVNSAAFDFDWQTTVEASWATGAYHFEWGDSGPMWPSSSWWSKYQTDDTPAPSGTWHYGRVTFGIAFLVNGGICVSGLPNAGAYVY